MGGSEVNRRQQMMTETAVSILTNQLVALLHSESYFGEDPLIMLTHQRQVGDSAGCSLKAAQLRKYNS